jgi:hypothetical protein
MVLRMTDQLVNLRVSNNRPPYRIIYRLQIPLREVNGLSLPQVLLHLRNSLIPSLNSRLREGPLDEFTSSLHLPLTSILPLLNRWRAHQLTFNHSFRQTQL